LGEENHAAPSSGTVGFFAADQPARAWRCSAFWQQTGRCRSCFISQVNEYLPDHHRVFDTGNYLDGTTTFAAGFNIARRSCGDSSPDPHVPHGCLLLQTEVLCFSSQTIPGFSFSWM
jgi:hypothetical protein